MGRILTGIAVLLAGCGGSAGSISEPTASNGSATGDTPRAASCPATATAPSPLPHVKPEYRTLAYWLAHTPDLDDVVLDPSGVRDLDAALAVSRGSDWHGEEDLTAVVDKAHVVKDTASRLEDQFQKLTKSELVEKDGTPVKSADVAMFDPKKANGLTVLPELHVALDAVPIRCGPREVGFYSKPAHAGDAPNTRFDRNACSTAHAQEVIQILGQWPNGMKLARTRYATGWIAANARLSPPIPDALRESYVHGARVQIDDDLAPQTTGVAAQCPAGTLLPLASGNRVRVAGADGFHETDIPEGHAQPTRRPLTRRALLTEAFHFIDTPYGWGGGGTAGGHDCSGFLMDLFAAFDIHLPRHSAWQTRAGSFSIDVAKVPLASERMRLIDAAAKKGIVLLGFPGHIMLYLGRNDSGTPMVMHALAEYVTPCAGGGETINQIDRITVSDLELGRGSSRTALIERITRIAVIGGAPGNELSGAAELRPAAPLVAPPPPAKLCKDSQEIAIYASPRRPNAKQPMRVIVTANHDPGAVDLVLFDGKGERVALPNVVHLNGPPWGTIATIDQPTAGTYTAVLGDGARVEACLRIAVVPRAPGTGGAAPPTAPTWEVQRSWTRATENLFSTFVQRLFDFPADQEVTWPDLQTLIKDPTHNILIDHLQKNEDQILKLRPDCADLPFVLRAYFAWKMGLPYGFHRCSRGTPTSPPVCKEKFQTNLMTRDLLDQKPTDFDELLPGEDDPKGKVALVAPPPPDPKAKPIADVNAFAMFWGRHVANTVHSATGRTLPGDDNTDYYPIPLGRESLRPGAVYIDPFGHVMIVAGWIPQTATSYGVLFAADGQPDGTVGRKRFWRGNFLFTTETKVSGAGFKAFRPALYHYATKTITVMKNSELKRSRMFTPFSTQEYEGNVDTFHDTMEALINPRPLDAAAAMTVLVDALHQQARLRVISIKNGEDWAAKNPTATMPMPEGAAIFLAAGAWEDFATPSRDFRLLIALDTVLGFPATVKRAPQRFGLEATAVDAIVKKLETDLDKMLRARTIEYVRSDGSKQTLSLHDLVERHAGFEVSYNPNDCAEYRWGAPAGSPEMATCQRHAPADQAARMEKYRVWFRDRKRPAR